MSEQNREPTTDIWDRELCYFCEIEVIDASGECSRCDARDERHMTAAYYAATPAPHGELDRHA